MDTDCLSVSRCMSHNCTTNVCQIISYSFSIIFLRLVTFYFRYLIKKFLNKLTHKVVSFTAHMVQAL